MTQEMSKARELAGAIRSMMERKAFYRYRAWVQHGRRRWRGSLY